MYWVSKTMIGFRNFFEIMRINTIGLPHKIITCTSIPKHLIEMCSKLWSRWWYPLITSVFSLIAFHVFLHFKAWYQESRTLTLKITYFVASKREYFISSNSIIHHLQLWKYTLLFLYFCLPSKQTMWIDGVD